MYELLLVIGLFGMIVLFTKTQIEWKKRKAEHDRVKMYLGKALD